MPFTHEQFLDLFGLYNVQLGPVVGALWLVTVLAVLAEVFLVAAVVYPLLALMTGHALPRAPLFAVPCPTTLLTAGLLLALGRQAPRGLLVVPILWSVVGGSAALTLGVLPDYLLIGAAVALATVGFLPSHRRQAAAQAR